MGKKLFWWAQGLLILSILADIALTIFIFVNGFAGFLGILFLVKCFISIAALIMSFKFGSVAGKTLVVSGAIIFLLTLFFYIATQFWGRLTLDPMSFFMVGVLPLIYLTLPIIAGILHIKNSKNTN